MHRFILPPDQTRGDTLSLEGPECKHATQVLRIRPDEIVEILNGQGETIRARVLETSRSRVSLKAISRNQALPLPYRLSLFMAIPKGKIMDAIVQKATELGTSRIQPLFTERTEVHLDSERGETKCDKWQTVVHEAMKQCGCPWQPQVDLPAPLGRLLASPSPFDLAVVASLEKDARHPREVMGDWVKQPGQPPRNLALWIGPEGDFSPAEYAQIKASGARPITLGPFVLRCDTAAVAALATLHFELQALGRA
jgi:16S rRNA (uracil1498-N3)-methyltransferase